jgi:molecular chaperone DnaJ
MPNLRSENIGDLYLEINVIVPENLSKDQKKLLEEFKRTENSDNTSEIKNFFNKAKKFWEKID